MSQLFISDLHLDENRDDITTAFLQFLRGKAASASSLYILGDFFEVWLGDDHDTPFNQKIIEALVSLNAEKFIMHGNRDFLLGDEFCQAIGATLLPDPTVIELNGQPVLLMHGDSLCTRDEQYMAARKMLRDPAVQTDLLSKSIEERAAIAQGARAESKAHTRETAEDIMDVTPDEVTRVMVEEGVRLLIHGHTHRPKVHDLNVDGDPAQRVVLGDWDKLGWYLEADEDGFRLASFEI
jgi:UDP-2,3-diacylglucosamine hydrolase